MAPSNTAAWQPSNNANSFEVRPAPYTPPKENQVVIRVRAVAINPVDWAVQVQGTDLFSFLQYPLILGNDVAGEIYEVGSGHEAQDHFKPGDRVIGQCMNVVGKNGPCEGGFQEYVVVKANVCGKIPASMTFEQAAVYPLAVGTAVGGLFESTHLGLQLPTFPAQKSSGKTVLIWGGSTSVGSNAVQLAVAAGYEVISTSSPRNFELVKGLGASAVFDYNASDVEEVILSALKGKDLAGAFAIGSMHGANNSAAACDMCMEIVAKCPSTAATAQGGAGPGRKFVAAAMMPSDKKVEGVEAKFVNGISLADDDLGLAIYRDFLPKALEAGTYQVAPQPEVVGKGLESIQKGIDAMAQPISAKKIVVSI